MRLPALVLVSVTMAVTPVVGIGQTVVIDPSSGGQAVLVPLDSSRPLFAPAGVDPVAVATGAPIVEPNRVGLFPGDVSVEVGFDYLTPFWSNDEFLNLLPGSAAGLFPASDLGTDVRHGFGFAPKIDLQHDFEDSLLGIKATGQYVHLVGTLQQSAGGAGALETLEAESSLTLINASLAELSFGGRVDEVLHGKRQRWNSKRCVCGHDFCHIGDWIVESTFGLRYGRLDQSFQANLRNGGSVVHAASSQLFRGIGPTVGFNVGVPLGPLSRIAVYSRNRFTVLIGDNIKRSQYALDLAGSADDVHSDLNQTRTEALPVGEFEAGVLWNNRTAEEVAADTPKSVIWVKAGFVGQVWGRAGMLAAGTDDGFRNGNLGLVGFTLQLGVQR
jgi:hypothetical protein